MNVVNLVGRVGNDPELRRTGADQSVTNISLATEKEYFDRNEKKCKKIEWHRLVFFGRIADFTVENVRKSDELGVEGELQTRTWRDRNDTERKTTEIVVHRLHLIGRNGVAVADLNSNAK